METKKKKNILNKIILPIILTLLGLVIGYLAAKFFSKDTNDVSLPLAWKLGALTLLPLAFFVVIALHEIGHVLAGFLVGFEFRMITVGPFMLEKEVDKLRFKWNKNLNTAGGLALCLPRNNHRILSKFMVFALGGPFMSLLLVVLAYVLALLFSINDEIQHLGTFLLNSFFNITWIFSFIIFIVTIIPMKSGGFYTDGGRFLNLWRGGAQAKLEATLLQTTSALFAGNRPSSMNEPLLKEAIDYPVNSPFKAYLHSFLYFYYLDTAQIDLAETHLNQYETHVADIPSGYQAMVWLEKAFFLAFYRKDAKIARQSLEKAKIGSVIPKATVLKTEAAVAFAENELPRAQEKAEEALAVLHKSMDKGTAKLEKDLLQQLLTKIESKC